LVQDGTGPTLATKGLTGGAGITLTGGANAVTIVNASPASDVTLNSAGGTTIVTDGTGPSLAVKGTTGSLLLEDTSTGIQIQFDNRAIRISDQNGDVPPLAGGDTANVNGSINATAVGPAAIVGAVSPFSLAAGYNCSVDPACTNALSIGNSSRAQAARAQAIGYDCEASGIDSWAMGSVAQAAGTRSMTWALSDGVAPYINARLDSVAIGQNIGGSNFTLFACSRDASTAILGFAMTRGRLCHGMRRDPTTRSMPYTLQANDVLQGSVFCDGTPGVLTTPTGVALKAANSSNPVWWATSTGADFYVKNKSGGAIVLTANTDVTIIDQTNLPVATAQVDDDNVGHFRVIYTGTDSFEFEWLGQATIPGAV
jgi:hypothetical protein